MAGINHSDSTSAKGVTVKIRNFAAFKGRKDVEHNSWFRCNNRLLEDPDFFGFSHPELLVWIYILSLSSQKNSDTVFVNFAHAERICRLEKRDVLSAVEKLKEHQLVPIENVTPTVLCRDGHVTQTCATEQDTTKQNITATGVPVGSDVARNSRHRQRINAFVEFSEIDSLTAAIDDATKSTWSKLYPDESYVPRELIKAWDYYRVNKAKAPKTLRGWTRALSSWLERGWSRHVRSIPTTVVDDRYDRVFARSEQ